MKKCKNVATKKICDKFTDITVEVLSKDSLTFVMVEIGVKEILNLNESRKMQHTN